MSLSLERVLKMLERFGLSRVESEVYLYLVKAGPSKAEDIVIRLRLSKQQLCPVLKNLKKKGLVTTKPEHAILFSALAFEELLNRYVKINIKQAETIRETKQELTDCWREIVKKNKT